MSRIGKKPVVAPANVDVAISDGTIRVKGPHGELEFTFHGNMLVTYDADARAVVVDRPDDSRENRALHGLTRSLIANMVAGVTQPFVKKLEIHGVGYNATLSDGHLALQVGFANTVRLPIPSRVTCNVPDATHVVVSSPDKQAVGQFAAEIRRVRPPEPYKGKGIRYEGEQIRRKAGKAFGAK